MIIYPKNWKEIGQPTKLKEIEDTILQILSEIDCNCLSFSGGLDSSLMLYFMLKVHKQVQTFTIGISKSHPDVRYSRLVIDKFDNIIPDLYIPSIIPRFYIPSWEEIKNTKESFKEFEGDNAVRLFYKFLRRYTDKIIACDGIDEFMCGYYVHQTNPNEETYYNYMKRLQKEQLIPLDKNSERVKVYLPYLDDRLILLLSQIPISEKVDKECRKKLMVEIAKTKIPNEIITRRKYGFCDVLKIK